MIKASLGVTKEPFCRDDAPLLSQQQTILDTLKIHSQQGGFSVIIGRPGVGKTVIKEHLEQLNQSKDTVVASFSRTLHTYLKTLKQLAESFQIDVPDKQLETELIHVAYQHVRDHKTLFTVVDEAHLLEMTVLRKLRLLFDRFPKKHNLVLLGQPELLVHLSLLANADLKSRITYSQTLQPLNDDDLGAYVIRELEAVRLGANTFDDGALELILRCAQGNLRLCRNLCYGSLVQACRHGQRIVTITHVNEVLVQPHWRSHDELIKQQVG